MRPVLVCPDDLLEHMVAAASGQLGRVAAAVKEAAPDAPLLVLRDDDRPMSGATVVPLSAFGERIIQPAVDRAAQRVRADRQRAHFYDAERVLILMQDDPDPDAIASALALKT